MPDPLILLLALLAAGALAGWLLAARKAAAERARFEEAVGNWRRAEHRAEAADRAEAELAGMRERARRLEIDLAAERAKLEEREKTVAQERDSLTRLRGELEEKFKALANDTFKAAQKSFLELADENFKRHKGDASARLEKLLGPMQETLKRYESNLTEIEKTRHEAYGNLTSELRNVLTAQEGVRNEAAKIVNALRAQPKTRGRWGEQQLQNVMELAGMSEHVDFVTQASFTDEEERRIVPDAIIRMPGGHTLVVDAKTSLSAYLEAIEAEDEAAREALLVKHAREIRTHMKQLASKSYYKALDMTPDFVVMFIPGENFFAAAVERDPALLEDAFASRVLIASPTTLVALAKSVAYGWRQEAMAENAREIAALGRDLYKRLATMGRHVEGAGKGLDSAVKAYNRMVGSLETMVMPQARRFRELEVEGTAEDIAALAPVETEPRPLVVRELLPPGEDEAE